MSDLGKLLMLAGAVITVAGVVVYLVGRMPGGGLPGDIVIHRKNTTIFFPIVTCIVVSVVVTLILNLIGRR